jgi:excisionase family DNA binding protein
LTHRSKPIKLEAIMEEWLKTKEAAHYLQVHPKTLYRYVRAGKLRQYQPGGVGRPRFKREELDALLQGEGESVNAAESTELTTVRQGSNIEVAEVQQVQQETISEAGLEDLAPRESLAFASSVERGFLSTGRSRVAQRERFISELAQILDEADFPSDVEGLVLELILGSAEGICERMEQQLSDV